jgi:hypothetical protein
LAGSRPSLDGVAGSVVEDRTLAGDGDRCGATAIQAHRQRVQRGADD